MTTTAKHYILCIAAIDLNAYRQEEIATRFNYHYHHASMRLNSQGGSCCVKPIAVLHLTVDGSMH